MRDTVVDELGKLPNAEVLLAFSHEPTAPERVSHDLALRERASPGHAVGIAVCFVGFSTFRARRLLNLHDLAVVPEARGRGVGRRLLAAVEARARELSCCKLTLEVKEGNARARSLYASAGFGDFAPGREQTRTLFLEKVL